MLFLITDKDRVCNRGLWRHNAHRRRQSSGAAFKTVSVCHTEGNSQGKKRRSDRVTVLRRSNSPTPTPHMFQPRLCFKLVLSKQCEKVHKCVKGTLPAGSDNSRRKEET